MQTLLLFSLPPPSRTKVFSELGSWIRHPHPKGSRASSLPLLCTEEEKMKSYSPLFFLFQFASHKDSEARPLRRSFPSSLLDAWFLPFFPPSLDTVSSRPGLKILFLFSSNLKDFPFFFPSQGVEFRREESAPFPFFLSFSPL